MGSLAFSPSTGSRGGGLVHVLSTPCGKTLAHGVPVKDPIREVRVTHMGYHVHKDWPQTAGCDSRLPPQQHLQTKMGEQG